jgi:hypothetical protein
VGHIYKTAISFLFFQESFIDSENAFCLSGSFLYFSSFCYRINYSSDSENWTTEVSNEIKSFIGGDSKVNYILV